MSQAFTTLGSETAVIFDLDGTLVDSVHAIRDVANALMDELGLAPLDLAETRLCIGRGAPRFLEQALTTRDAFDPESFAERVARFEHFYAVAPGEANRPFPGVEPMLARLREQGHAIGLCTNKPEAATRTVLEALGWADVFGAVIAGDSLTERKPHPLPLQETARRLGRPRVAYVGDSEVDAETAQAAALPFLLYTEGYRRTPAEELPARVRFSEYETFEQYLSAALEN